MAALDGPRRGPGRPTCRRCRRPAPGRIDLVPRPASVQSNLRLGGSFARLGEAGLARRLAGRANPERDVQLPHRRQHPGTQRLQLLAPQLRPPRPGRVLVHHGRRCGDRRHRPRPGRDLLRARAHGDPRDQRGGARDGAAPLGRAASASTPPPCPAWPRPWPTWPSGASTSATSPLTPRRSSPPPSRWWTRRPARYLAPSRLVTAVVGDPEVVTGPLSALGEVALRS